LKYTLCSFDQLCNVDGASAFPYYYGEFPSNEIKKSEFALSNFFSYTFKNAYKEIIVLFDVVIKIKEEMSTSLRAGITKKHNFEYAFPETIFCNRTC